MRTLTKNMVVKRFERLSVEYMRTEAERHSRRQMTLAEMNPLAIKLCRTPEWVQPGELAVLQYIEPVQQIVRGTFSTMNLEKTMGHLGGCGRFLRLALMAAGDHKCSQGILELAVDYFDSTGRTVIATEKMVMRSLESLKYHKIAFKDFDDCRFVDGQQIFKRVAQMSKEMQKLPGEMVDQVLALKEKSMQQLKDTKKEKCDKAAEQAQIEADVKRMELEQADEQAKVEQHRQEAKDFADREKQRLEEAKEAERVADEKERETQRLAAEQRQEL